MSAAIDVEDLTVAFGSGRHRLTAVHDFSFSVPAGGSFGLVGESGAGKSTVVSAIAGLLANWTGRIRLGGRSVAEKRTLADRRLVQMVFQDPYGSLHPRHTVDRILAEPAGIHGLDRVEERIVAALKDVGLGPEHRFRYPHQLSGGQRQRVAIARALVLEPGILLLDEPTSALDVSVQAEVLNLLRRLREDRGITLVMVSHNLAVISFLCDRLAVMQHGRLVEMVEAAQLRDGRVAEAYTRELLTASGGAEQP
jgi:peptide/nickel transport system ATP-binding protein